LNPRNIGVYVTRCEFRISDKYVFSLTYIYTYAFQSLRAQQENT